MTPLFWEKQGDIILNLLRKQAKQLFGNIPLIKRMYSFQIDK